MVRGGGKKAIGIAVIVIFGIVGFMFVSGIFAFNQETLEKSIKDIPANIKESVKNIQEDLPKTTSIVPTKSKLIGKSTTVKQIEYTILDVTYSESKNPKYSKLMTIKIKAENHSNEGYRFLKSNFYVLDQHMIRYNIPNQSDYLKPSIPQDLILKFEIPKDDSLQFSLHLSVHSPQVTTDNVKLGTI